MRQAGVRRQGDAVVVESQTSALSCQRDLRVHRLRARPTAELGAAVGLPVNTLGWQRGVEFVGEVANGRTRRADFRQGAFEVSMADPAPRADEVGGDQYVEGFHV